MKVKRKILSICMNKIRITKITPKISLSPKNRQNLLHPLLHLKIIKNKSRRTLTSLKTITLSMNKKTANIYINKKKSKNITLHHAKKSKKKKITRVSTRMMTQLLLSRLPLRLSTINTPSSSINPQSTNQMNKIIMCNTSNKMNMMKTKKNMILNLQAVAVSMSRRNLLSQLIKACRILFKTQKMFSCLIIVIRIILKVVMNSNCRTL